ncbi:MAG: RluA family pseudouridine synthase [Deltaproteobacteria bacterium]|nr:RluA family pseudouridine synthase [Deltaproteobacteria bacterium]
MSDDESIFEDDTSQKEATDDEANLHEGKSPAYGHPDAVCMNWKVPEVFTGTRADVYLANKVGRLSRVRARRIIDKGDFRLSNERFLKPSTRMREQEVSLWRLPPDRKEDLKDNVEVLFEDDALLVVNKPTDLVVHPSARYLHRTLTYWLRVRGDGVPVAHPCHRLDRETSGVLVCAKTKEAQRGVKRTFANQQNQKIYLAVVQGVGIEKQSIDLPLALQGWRGLVRIRMIPDDKGLPAQTDVVPLLEDTKVNRTLIACFPKTGRQHQIRAHCAAIGFPLVGDKLYAFGDEWFDRYTLFSLTDDDQALVDHPRHALHAFSLRLPFASNETYFAPFPDELRALLPNEKAHIDDVISDLLSDL